MLYPLSQTGLSQRENLKSSKGKTVSEERNQDGGIGECLTAASHNNFIFFKYILLILYREEGREIES